MSGEDNHTHEDLTDKLATDEMDALASEDAPQAAADSGTDAPGGDNEHVAEVSDTETEEEAVPLTVQLEQAEARAGEYLDSLQRERAAFQNYKRRVERERIEQHQATTGNLLLKLLPVLDDFYRAMDAVPDEDRAEWFEGVALIQRKLEKFLEEQGVTEIEALGASFDPNYHEAIGVDSDADADADTVTEVLLRGYLHHDRVLRPAMVRVAG